MSCLCECFAVDGATPVLDVLLQGRHVLPGEHLGQHPSIKQVREPVDLGVIIGMGIVFVYAVLGGMKAEINMALVMSKRLTLTGSTLRPRSDAFKTALRDEIDLGVNEIAGLADLASEEQEPHHPPEVETATPCSYPRRVAPSTTWISLPW